MALPARMNLVTDRISYDGYRRPRHPVMPKAATKVLPLDGMVFKRVQNHSRGTTSSKVSKPAKAILNQLWTGIESRRKSTTQPQPELGNCQHGNVSCPEPALNQFLIIGHDPRLAQQLSGTSSPPPPPTNLTMFSWTGSGNERNGIGSDSGRESSVTTA